MDNKDYSENGLEKIFSRTLSQKVMEKGYLVVVSLVSPYRDLRIGEIFYLDSSRPLRKQYHVDDYEPPLENFTEINTDKSIKECVDEIFNVYRKMATMA